MLKIFVQEKTCCKKVSMIFVTLQVQRVVCKLSRWHISIAYRISSFKRLALEHLGVAFIRGRRLLQKSKQKKIKSNVNSKQLDIS